MRPAGSRVALLIAVAGYRDERLPDLAGVAVDAREFGAVLRKPDLGGFAVDDVGPTGKADEIKRAIARFADQCGPGDLALLYFSGHGMRATRVDGQLYLIASDTDPDRLTETAVSASFVNEQLERCLARQKIAIFDCCMSGGFALGLRTRDEKSGRTEDLRAPVETEGVYVICSCRVSESSFSGADDASPSQFTGAMVEGLRTGEADIDRDGQVSMDDLFRYVSERMRIMDRNARQTPVKSSLQVTGELYVARSATPSRRFGARTFAAGSTGAPRATPSDRPTGPPSWSALVNYYRDVVVAETVRSGFYDARPDAAGYVCLAGAERLLSGRLDEDAGIAVPPEAEKLILALQADAKARSKDLLYGYPVVVLHQRPGQRNAQCAPLLLRQVRMVEHEHGMRLEPYGTAQVNPALIQELVGDSDAAARLACDYRSSWRAGGEADMVRDIRYLLREEFALEEVEPLRPDRLNPLIDIATPTDGARNAAMLLPGVSDAITSRLVADLEQILGKQAEIPRTALGMLTRRPAAGERTGPQPRLVFLGRSNDAQCDVLRSVMRGGVTVATGPPGTGKSELISNLVATAVAAGRSVLVASTNNQAVDEVWSRCEARVPGLVIRTGNQDYRAKERDGLVALLAQAARQRDGGLETARAAHSAASRAHGAARTELAAKATHEAGLLQQGRARREAAEGLRRLGTRAPAAWTSAPDEELARDAGTAARAAAARFFGISRCKRLLRRRDIAAAPGSERAVCNLLRDYAAAELVWRDLRRRPQPTDASISAVLDAADDAARQAGAALAAACVTSEAVRSAGQIQTLLNSLQGIESANSWSVYPKIIPSVRGWAVSALSARNFPVDAGLFDLVVIDEASQCSIAATLPLLFRAKSALIIGDPMQLRHIASLSPHEDALRAGAAGIDPAWLAEQRLTYQRHSCFDAWEAATGGSLLLDEHYRCHPQIAALADGMFYEPRGKKLTVLTDTARLLSVPGSSKPRVAWDHVSGKAESGPRRTSWVNHDEARRTVDAVRWFLDTLPDPQVGVVTPFRPQADLIRGLLGPDADRVRVGTVHSFQGGECDAIVFSLVGTRGIGPGGLRFFDRDENLWNVAVTRAKAFLLVVGDREFWQAHGALGGRLADHMSRVIAGSAAWQHGEELRDLLYTRLVALGAQDLELCAVLGDHRVDARYRLGPGEPKGILLDSGPADGVDPERHLHRQIVRTTLVDRALRASASGAARVPAWLLYADDDAFSAEVIGRR